MFERIGTLFTVLLLVAAGGAVLSALHWRQEVAMFPLFVGTSALVLSATELGREIWALTKGKRAAREPRGSVSREWAGPLWFFGCVAAALVFGIPFGLPLSLILLLRYGFGESWVVAAATGVVMGAMTLFLFGAVFGVIWPRPLLLDLF